MPRHCRSRALADGARRAPALPGRGLLVAVHLLHASAAPRRGCRLQPHRGCPRGTPLPRNPRSARGGIGDADDRPVVGAALDGGESSERARVGTPQGEAGGRGTRRIASSLAGRSVNDPEVARPPTGPAGYEPRRTHANVDSAEPASGHAGDQDGAATDGDSPGAGALQTAVHDLGARHRRSFAACRPSRAMPSHPAIRPRSSIVRSHSCCRTWSVVAAQRSRRRARRAAPPAAPDISPRR